MAKKPPLRVRRTQQERSDTMRARLLEATVESLLEVGYSRTSTIEVAARAGVSRGAQLHHYATKKKLVAAAVRHILQMRLDAFRVAFEKLPEGADRHAAAVDLLWEGASSDAFYAWLELLVAARTDASLRKTIVDTQREFSEEVQKTFRLFFSSTREFDVAPVFALAVMQGLALNRIVDPQDQRIAMSLMVLKALASGALRSR